MLEITIKTLDGQNRCFSVPDDISVVQFKERISASVGITAETQRLIYHGRVLHDDKKLAEYDVGGKVVHLVQKLPPSSRPSGTGTTSGGAGPGAAGNHDGFVIGAFTVPSDTIDHSQVQQVVQQVVAGMGELGRNARVTTSPAGDGQSLNLHINLGLLDPVNLFNDPLERINMARRLVEMTNAALDRLENLDAEGSQTGGTESSNDMEIPPLVETSGGTTGAGTTGAGTAGAETAGVHTDSTDAASRTSNVRPPRPPCRPQSLADVMSEIIRASARLQPFMERYQRLMQEDADYGADDDRIIEAQQTFNLVSAAMHHMGHAYHDVSDLMIDMRHTPPRHLINPPRVSGAVPSMHHRPAHAVPMQAQISVPVSIGVGVPVSREPSMMPATSATSQTSTSTSSSTASSAERSEQPQSTRNGTMPASSQAGVNPSNQFMFWEVGPTSVTINRIHATVVSEPSNQETPIVSTVASTATSANSATTTAPTFQAASAMLGWGPPHGAVPPGGIPPGAIPLGAIPPGAIPPGAIPPGAIPPGAIPPGAIPAFFPPDLLQNLMGAAAGVARAMPGAFPQPNNASFPTTSTRTRPTATVHIPRPHGPPGMAAQVPIVPHPLVALDPFLPCSSRHSIPPRARGSSTPGTPQAGHDPHIAGMVGGIVNSLIQQQIATGVLGGAPLIGGIRPQVIVSGAPPPGVFVQGGPIFQQGPPGTGSQAPPSNQFIQQMASLLRGSQQSGNQAPPHTGTPTSGTAAPPAQQGVTDEIFLNLIQGITGQISGGQQQITIRQFLESMGENAEEEGLLSEILMSFADHLTFSDLMALMFGSAEPLNRMRPQLVDCVRQQVLQNTEPTEANIDAAIDRIMNQIIGPLRVAIRDVEVNPGIDYIATMDRFGRMKLSEVVAIILGSDAVSPAFGEHLLHAVHHGLQEFMALNMHCLHGGEAAFASLVAGELRRMTADTNPLIQQWMVNTTTQHLATAIPNVSVAAEEVQQYVTRIAVAPERLHVEAPIEVAPCSAPVEMRAAAEAEEKNSSDESMHSAQEPDDAMPMDFTAAAVDWQSLVPSNWIPVIARDIDSQAQQPIQRSLSDAYLQGMPAKRRKVSSNIRTVNGKPLSSALPETLKKAIAATGAVPLTSLDAVSQEAAESGPLRRAFEQQVKDDVRASIDSNKDYSAERFPHAEQFFRK